MSDGNIVITVRLSDVEEVDQPDPICLPADELTTWRHFEVLLQSMYRDPPSAIRVCYLDDESDWIEVSSDAEFHEAIRVVRGTDAILQIQVKRVDAPQPVYFESTLPPQSSHGLEPDGPHVTPLCTTYYNRRDNNGQQQHQQQYPQPLVYPYPPYLSATTTSSSSGHRDTNGPSSGSPYVITPLSYPHPIASDFSNVSLSSCVDTNTSDNNAAAYPSPTAPVLHPEMMNEGLNACTVLAQEEKIGDMFSRASNYSMEDKIKFMKDMATQDSTGEVPGQSNSKKGGRHGSELLIEPLSSSNTHSDSSRQAKLPSPTSLAVQDPFEVVCQDKPSRDLEQIQLNMQPGNILKPEKKKPSTRESSVSSLKENGGGKRSDDSSVSSAMAGGTPRPPSASVMPPPIPLLYHMQMMDGAQSGANAVAIEMPDGDHPGGAAHKEEDGTASGGASCTSASAETGEVINTRTCHDGAAVGDKVKVRTSHVRSVGTDQTCAQPSSGVSAGSKASTSKKSKKSSDPSPSKTSLKESATADKVSKGKKEAAPSSSKATKKEEKKRSKETSSPKLVKDKSGSRMEADVESGEKIVKRKKSSSGLKTKDFVKLITKMQTELHSGIVKDVGKQTDKLLKQTFSRSLSYDSAPSLVQHSDEIFEEVVHRGIYCDGCNLTIRGVRFKCGNCPDFDFCENCESSPHSHDPSHVFLKLSRPAPLAGRVEAQMVPLLREVVYRKDNNGGAVQTQDSGKKSKIECLEDVPILSISEVPTPGEKHSPPSTPSESHKKADVSHWVWDSTFDTDKHLYPMEGESTAAMAVGGIGSGSGFCPSNQTALGNSEMRRLYALLSIEAEAAKRADRRSGEELIVEMPKVTSLPEIAESLHSLSTLPTTTSVVTSDDILDPMDAMPLLRPPTTTPAETSSPVEVISSTDTNNNDEDELQHQHSVELEQQSVLAATPRPQAEGQEETSTTERNEDDDGHSEASSAEFLDAEEEDEEEEDDDDEEGEESFEELGVDEEEEEEEGEKEEMTVVEHACDSDTSDDFCVLDPPSQSDAGQEDEDEDVHHTPDVPCSEMVDHVRSLVESDANAAVVIAAADDDNGVVVTDPAVKSQAIAPDAEKEMSVADEEVIEAVNVQKSEIWTAAADVMVVESKSGVREEKVCGENVKIEEQMRESTDEKDVSVVGEMDYTQEDVLMKMSGEERCRFLEMVKSLKDRAEDLETELKKRKETELEEKKVQQTQTQQKGEEMELKQQQQQRHRLEEQVEAEAGEEVRWETEAMYQMILAEKQKEAVRENEKLEQLQKKKELEERSKRQQRLMEKEKERKLRQKKNNKDLKLSPGGSMGEGTKKKTRAASSSVVAAGTSTTKSPTLMQMALNKNHHHKDGGGASAMRRKGSPGTAVAVKQEVVVPVQAPVAASDNVPPAAPLSKAEEDPASPQEPQTTSTAAATTPTAHIMSMDNVVYVQSSDKKDADCQTSGGTGTGGGADAAAQASQMIQQVASNVSKAAEAAFLTAKDVFYSLQAKQVEKKTYEGVVYSKTTPINSKASSTDATNTSSTTTTIDTNTDKTEEPKQEQGQEAGETTTSSNEATWIPPSSVWTPPPDTYVPPKSEWTPSASTRKLSNSNWVPPKSKWTPPASSWKPSNSDWVPPKSDWVFPKSEWTPPKSEWIPPPVDGLQRPVRRIVNRNHYYNSGEEGGLKITFRPGQKASWNESDDTTPTTPQSPVPTTETAATTATTVPSPPSTTSTTTTTDTPLPPLPPIQITDPILRRQVQGMQLLIEMGFANREQNRRLLQEFEGDVEKAVQSLLQEERSDHWAWGQRH